MTRRLGTAITIGLAALLISGCSWGTFQKLRLLPAGYEVTVHKSSSTQIINSCSDAHPGDSTGRANCALDTIRMLCASQPLAGYSSQQCQFDTSPGYTASMKQAIRDVLGGDDECLSFQDLVDASENRFWAGEPDGHSVIGGVRDCP